MILVFDGPDGSGKSTVAKEIALKYKSEYVRFPGHTKFGGELRELLLNPQSQVSKRAALFGFLTDMLHTVDSLDPHKDYVFDRYLYSTFVYQVMTSGEWCSAEREVLKKVFNLFPSPDLVFILDADYQTAQKRLDLGEFGVRDRYEAEGKKKWEARRDAYRTVNKHFPEEEFIHIDTSDLSQETVQNMVESLIKERLKWHQ